VNHFETKNCKKILVGKSDKWNGIPSSEIFEHLYFVKLFCLLGMPENAVPFTSRNFLRKTQTGIFGQM